MKSPLRKLADPNRAKATSRFFKTGPGEYGEGDLFLGVAMPEVRRALKSVTQASPQELRFLMRSKFHEERMLGLLILVYRYQKTKTLSDKKKILTEYLSFKKYINNWDLVDLTAYKILGDYTFNTKDSALLNRLLNSRRHWDRRMAVVSTLAWTKKGDHSLIFKFSEKLFDEKEDLMHKACGWMLREAGKVNRPALEGFIRKNAPKMPRTMLRYAIEHFDEKERKKILVTTRR